MHRLMLSRHSEWLGLVIRSFGSLIAVETTDREVERLSVCFSSGEITTQDKRWLITTLVHAVDRIAIWKIQKDWTSLFFAIRSYMHQRGSSALASIRMSNIPHTLNTMVQRSECTNILSKCLYLLKPKSNRSNPFELITSQRDARNVPKLKSI